jgi:putative ABC transport system permease protein
VSARPIGHERHSIARRTVLKLAGYRFRTTMRRNVSGYLSVVLIVGLVGGVAMASIAGARRTQSSYPTFLASVNPSQLTMAVYSAENNGGASPVLTSAISHAKGVRRVRTLFAPPLVPLTRSGAPRLSTLGYIESVGSPDGMLSDQDRLAFTQGHAANQSAINEITLTATAASVYGVHVGDVIPMGLYSPAQENLPGFGTARVRPVILIHAKVMGIAVLDSQVVQDDVDKAFGFVFVTRALIHRALKAIGGHPGPALYGIQLAPGVSVASVETELANVVPRHYVFEFHVLSVTTSEVELSVKPESVALGAFGAIAALACLVLAAQAIARSLRRSDEDRQIMRALGASPVDTTAEGLIGVLGAIVLGSLVAAALAIALSPLAPLGPVRPFYPSPGVSFDWTVLGVGVAVLVMGLSIFALAQSHRVAPHRVKQSLTSSAHRSGVARAAQTAGMSVAGVVGVHFALESGRGRTAVPVRSVLVGTVVAVTLVVATLTFASGLSTLVSHPPLYGWNWNYALNPTNDVPPATMALLRRDRDVAAFSGVDYTDIEIDGETFPILLTNVHAKVSPPILSGHAVDAKNEIVLGAATMALLKKHLGQSVTVSFGSADDAPDLIPPTKLRIVGTATLPAVGYSSFVAEHTSMGTGAIVPMGVQPAAMKKTMESPDPNLNGPELVFVRMKRGVSARAGRASMQYLANEANSIFAHDKNGTGQGVDVLGVERPAQIVNYRSVGSTPIILAGGLALGAVLALGLTLGSSVRRRRRDLALLKAFGFTQRQLTAAITWQATVDAVVGIVFGLPIGILVGRELWTLFAQSINAVPDATVPVLAVLLVGLGTLIFTNAVAILPGITARRTPTALVLRAE